MMSLLIYYYLAQRPYYLNKLEKRKWKLYFFLSGNFINSTVDEESAENIGMITDRLG